MKKLIVILGLLVVFAFAGYSDEINRKGRSFFGDNPSLDSYIMAVLHSPDVEIRIYAIRQLAKSNDNRAVDTLIKALKLGVEEIEATVPQHTEGPSKIRSAAAIALGYLRIRRDVIILELRKALMLDPSQDVQANCAIAMGILGSRSNEAMRKRIVSYLKRKVARTNKNSTKLLVNIVRAFGINRHSDARLFLNLMRSTGYGALVNREISRALRKLR